MQTAYRILVAGSADKLAAGRGDLWDSGRVKSDASIMIPYAGRTLTQNQACFWKVQVWDRDGYPTSWSHSAQWTMGLFSNTAWKGKWIRSRELEQEWRDYELDANFTINKGAVGIYFRGRGTGNAYMWQINTANGRAEFKPHIRENGGFRVLKQIPLPNFSASDISKPHEFKITVSGQTIETRVDGELIDKTTDATFGAGGIGLRESPDETAIFHTIRVMDASGRVLYDSNFKKGRILAPGSQIGPDGLTVTGGDFLLKDADQSAIQSPLFRKEFPITGRPIRRAWLYASALGIYQLSLNGKRVGDQYFVPGWTNYRKTVEYQTYDVTSMIHPGLNALGAQVTPGWYAGNIAWFDPNHYGNRPAFMAEMHVVYTDGTSAIVAATDDSWKSNSGPVVAADNLDGEDYDARRERAGWDLPGFDDSAWHRAAIANANPSAKIVAQIDPPIRALQKFPAYEVSEPKPGTYIYKFPQDINGFARVKITGKAGQTVHIQYAEGLTADGNLDLKNMSPPGIPESRARATDSYTFGQHGVVLFQPDFTWRGYQYIQITGAKKRPALEDVVGLSIGTDVPVIGHLQTSSVLLNRIFLNIFWSGRDAYMSYPMDCPQRSERLGWTGDANFYLATATQNFDMDRFYSKWENDLLDSQREDGLMNNVSPSGWGRGSEGGYGGGWGDAAVCVPYELWRHYGDVRIIEHCYPGLVKWLDFLKTHAPGFIVPADLAPAGDWMYQNICGISHSASDVGFKKITIRPLIGGGLTSAHASYECPYDTIKTSWRIDGNRLVLSVEVPVNTTAEIYVPSKNPSHVTETGKPFRALTGVQSIPGEDGFAVFTVGSGSYTFATNALQ